MKKKVRVGVIGVGRGESVMNYCKAAENAELVAICDKWEEGLNASRAKFGEENIGYYTDYDKFLEHDMDVVMLANYANQHAPFAIKAMNKGLNVISEVLPCQTMKEAVELIETVERTGKIYCYAENYCYMPAPREMKRLYRDGVVGEIEYAEGEYVHNCEPIWTDITYGDKNHWRNMMYSTYYCTHSLGPIIHISGLRPVKVSGFELPFREQNVRMGLRGSILGIEMVTLENGALVKSIHGDIQRNNISYEFYGKKGRMESAREAAAEGDIRKLYLEYSDNAGEYSDDKTHREVYNPRDEMSDKADPFGHGGSDYYTIWNAIEKIAGNPDADTIDVYEALDMFLPGMFAYRSILNGGIPVDVPNLRDPAEREKWRNDTACTDPEAAGDMLLPFMKDESLYIPDESYDKIKAEWLKNHTEK